MPTFEGNATSLPVPAHSRGLQAAQDPLRYACQFQLFVGGYQPLPDPQLNPVSVCNQQFSACSHLFLAQIISLCIIAPGLPLV